jgi:SAM-dependent methyltransferase
MREGAHPGRNAAYPAQDPSHKATRALRHPLRDGRRGRVGRKRPQISTREPIIQEPEPFEPEATRREAGSGESTRANRGWWDRNADEYQVEHGTFLGDDRFVWGPEGLDEIEAELLGPMEELAGKDVLEIGAGAAQCSRWLAAQGARPVALDLSHRQLQHALRIGAKGVGLVEADAGALPFADASFDLACSAYGALPFVADPVKVLREVHRVLRPGGRFVFSVTHPIRWAFPDEPGPEGLTVTSSYFDRTPYVEQDDAGSAVYVEHPQDRRRPRPGRGGGRFPAGRPRRAAVARLEHPGVGRLVAPSGKPHPGVGDLRVRAKLDGGARGRRLGERLSM